MDAKTILFLFGLISLCIGLVYLYFVLVNKKRNGFLLAYAIGKFFLAAGVIFISNRLLITDYIALNIGASLLVLGYATGFFCVISHDNRFKKSTFYVIALPIILSVLTFLVYQGTTYLSPAILLYVVIGFLSIFSGIKLISGKQKTSTVSLVAFAYLGFSAAWFAAATGAIILGAEFQIVSGSNIFELVIYFASVIYLIIESVGYLMILKEKDESEIAEKNEIIVADNKLLKELNIKKDTFFSIIAHDLKNPIASLIQLGQVLEESHHELRNEDREKMLNAISTSARKTYNLLENLLQWSRAETGRLKVKPAAINIKNMLDDNLILLQESIHQKNITIHNKIQADTFAWGDLNMIHTVIRNILSNAIKFVHKNGNIYLSATNDLNANSISITIQDDGVGMEQEIVNKLFELDNDYTSKGTNNESGTGLGLKLCKEFITQNKGDIRVNSAPGKGSSFHIVLPGYVAVSKVKKAV